MPDAVRRDGLVHDAELQPDRRLGKAWELDAQPRAALRASSRERGGRLVDLEVVEAMGTPKGRYLGGVPVHGPATAPTSLDRGPRGGSAAVASTAVDHDLDPGGPREVSPKSRERVRAVLLDDDHPSGPLRRDTLVALVALGVRPMSLPDDLVATLPEKEAEVVPRVVGDQRIGLQLVAAAASPLAARLRADRRADCLRRAELSGRGQGAESQFLEDSIFTDALGAHWGTSTGNDSMIVEPDGARQPFLGNRAWSPNVDVAASSG